ncbi:Nn.00g117400.m01.CDS01 [Neocucurbitaria sp. VM-36]
MPISFFSLPSELRNTVYELVLLHQEPIYPCVYYSQHQKLTPELFRANKAVHREASSLFYSRNSFDLTDRTAESVASFLDQIGQKNAGYIRQIYIDFPTFSHLDVDDIAIKDDSACILTNIQKHCTNLSTLTTSLYSTNAMELRLDAIEHPKIVSEALRLADTYFRAIVSLQDIMLEVYEDGPSAHIRKEMKSHGWTIIVAENLEETGSNRSFAFSDDYDHDYRYASDGDDYGDDDEYDIDNDSDFWRRAGD